MASSAARRPPLLLPLLACGLVVGFGCSPPAVEPVGPRLVMTAPGVRALDVSTTLEALTLVFDREMDPASGSVVLSGGTGSLGAPVWNVMGLQALVPVVGPLDADTDYEVTLVGFRSADGQEADLRAWLPDGVLEFTTGAAPEQRVRVVSSRPAEGAVEVAPDTPSISVTFDAAMDTSQSFAMLSGCAAPNVGPGAWSEDARTITFPLAGALPPESTCTLDGLGAFTDAEGHFLDLVTYLRDGALDFSTGRLVAPRVVRTSPASGTSGVDTHLAEIHVTFDKRMDPSTGTARLTGGQAALASPLWNDARQLLVLRLLGPLEGLHTYTLALTGYRDAAGVPLPETNVTFTTEEALPGIASVTPADRANGVALDLRAVVVTFSGVMDPAEGRWTLQPGVDPLDASPVTPVWSANDTVATVPMSDEGLAPSTTYTLTLDGLVTSGGRALEAEGGGPLRFTFRTGALTRPQVIATTPSPGATGVPIDLASLTLTFDTSMDFLAGQVTVTDGPPGLAFDRASATVSSVNQPHDTLTLPRLNTAAPLPPASTYTVSLEGFRDASGTSCDDGPGATLPGATLTFTTEADTVAPRLTAEVPSFLSGTPGTLDLYFNERLQHEGVEVALRSSRPHPEGIAPVEVLPLRFVDTNPDAVTGTTRLTIPVTSGLVGFRGPLVAGVTYTLTVTGLRDLAGNAFGPYTHTVTPPQERVRPYILTSLPTWGGSIDGRTLPPVVLTFTRSMHRMDGDIRPPVLDDGESGVTFAGPVWSDNNTKATFPLTVTTPPAPGTFLHMRLLSGAGSDYRDAGAVSVLNFATDPSAWQVGCIYNQSLEFELAY